jgi:hypothetical protein
MIDNMEHKDSKFWLKVANNEQVDFNDVFGRKGKEYYASVDFPSSVVWQQQLKQYPSAKVILTIREFESWYRSCQETIFKMSTRSPYAPVGTRTALSLGLPHPGFAEMASKLIDPNPTHTPTPALGTIGARTTFGRLFMPTTTMSKPPYRRETSSYSTRKWAGDRCVSSSASPFRASPTRT